MTTCQPERQTSLDVELTSPQSVNGVRVPYQSLWLLIRMLYAALYSEGDRTVRLVELHTVYRDARSLRMVISRAFRDFTAWGVQAGWGEDTRRNPLFLNAEGRSQGPFWLNDEQAKRICCMVHGHCADKTVLEDFLGLSVPHHAGATVVSHVLHPLSFWGQLLSARQDLHLGNWRASLHEADGGSSGALAGFRQAAGVATDHFQHALAVLGEASVWRRLDDHERAQTILHDLQAHLNALPVEETGYITGMRQIMVAWSAYSQCEYPRALGLLEAMLQKEPEASICRYNPRIRFEWNNLAALIYRAQAMEKSAGLAQRIAAAELALARFTAALYAAFEGNTLDAAQHVAANIGFTLWLCDREAILDCPEGITGQAVVQRAVQWIGLSEALRTQSGNTQPSVWNLIYLLRISRGHCPQSRRPDAAAFMCYPVYDPTALTAWMVPFERAFTHYPSWLDAVDAQLSAHEVNQRYLNHSQLVNLLYEKTWLMAHAGQWKRATETALQVRSALLHLPAADRRFFRQAMTYLPMEVEDHIAG